MRIVVDGGLYLSAPLGGGFNYMNEMLPRLAKRQGIEVDLLTPRGGTEPPKEEGLKIKKPVPLPTGGWFPDGLVKRRLSKLKKDIEKNLWRARFRFGGDAVFHSVGYQTSPFPRFASVPIIYDMITEIFADRLTGPGQDDWRRRKALTIAEGDHFLAISECTKRDLCRIANLSPDNVTVMLLGVNQNVFNPVSTQGEKRDVHAKYGIPHEPFLLYVGGRLHHKNFDRFIEAYATSPVRKAYRLVAAGHPWSDEERARLGKLGIADRAHYAKIPSDSELRVLYQLSSGLVYPSYYEGFGLPPLEAMACGAPVALSDASSLPEVAGEAGLYFNPHDTASIAAAMEKLVDSKESARLRALGFERVKQFDWDRTVDKALEGFHKGLEARRGASASDLRASGN